MKPTFYYNLNGGDLSEGTVADAETQTDNTRLVTTDTVYVSPDGGTTDEAFPKQGVEYDFCVDVANGGNLASGPFYVRFTLSGDQDPAWEQDFKQDAGLDAGQNVKAVVHFGSFPNEFKSYFLEACIYSESAPNNPINCAGTFEFSVNTESTGSGSSDTSSSEGSNGTSSDTSSGTSSTPAGGSNTSDNTSTSENTPTSFTPISYDVELIPQPDKLSCWAASMAMVVGYKRQQSINPETLANEVGRSLRTSYSWDMLEEVRDHYGFKSVIDVPADTCVYYEPRQWKEWLETYGPLWYTFIWDSGGSHAMVLKGISGDLTPQGTFFDIQNPWDLHTTFDSDPVDFNPANNGCSESIEFLRYSSLFGDLGYDVNHASFRIMYLP